MTVGPTGRGPEAARPGFRLTREAVDRLGLSVCSMGMTDDLEVAVEEGSTQIRVGTALFGERPTA
jgi:PLP dependent protein